MKALKASGQSVSKIWTKWIRVTFLKGSGGGGGEGGIEAESWLLHRHVIIFKKCI